MNDLIGIGCTVDSLKNREVEVGDKIRNYRCYVYKLVNCSKPQIEDEIILLSDDEENEKPSQTSVESITVELTTAESIPIRKNGITNCNDLSIIDLLESGDEVLVDCVGGVMIKNENAMDIQDEDDDYNDIEQNQYSQQMVLNIKEEAQHFVISDDDDDGDDCSKENYENAIQISTVTDNDNDNEPDENDDDADPATSKWLLKLSQDQDKHREKTSDKNHQKRAKMIDSMPMKRRQSVSSRVVPPKRRKSLSTSSSASGSLSPLVERRKSVTSARSRMSIKLDGFIKPKRHEADKKDLAECRKLRLSEIAHNQLMAKLKDDANSKERVTTKPKVKISESRGAFLQEPITNEKKRLKSKSEVDENRKQHQLIGVPSTSKGLSKNYEVHGVYAHDPEPSNGILVEIDDQYNSMPKKRTARVKSTYTPITNNAESNKSVAKDVNARIAYPVSILKKSCDGNDEKRLRLIARHIKSSVRFKDVDELFEFEAGENEDDDILVNVPSCVQSESRNKFQSDPLHKIISEVTSWDVDWLLKKKKMPPITDADHVITPLLNKYPSFEEFQK